MRIQSVGDSGLRVSSLTLGTMGWGDQVDADGARELFARFRDAGGFSFDTAFGYGGGAAETLLGSLVSAADRDQVCLIGKAGISRGSGARVVDASRGTLMRQLDDSLRRLGVDHLDLWLVHTWDGDVPLAETMSALEAAHRSGRARYVGVSNYAGWQLAEAAGILAQARIPLVANEIEYSLLARRAEAETIPAGGYRGAGVLAWAPLAGGVLTGKYRHGTPADSRAAGGQHGRWADRHLGAAAGPVVAAVCTAAEGLGVSPSEVALAWLRDRPTVASSIVGARNVNQLKTLLDSEQLVIPEAIKQALDEVSTPA